MPEGVEPAEPQGAELPTVLIQPTHGWRAVDLGEIWRYRGLLYFLTWRDIKVRYKQTLLGATWAIIQPLLTTLVFTVLFGVLMGRGKEPTIPGIPYPVSTFCAMLPWNLFAHSLSQSGNSLVNSRNLITKIYFPRLVIPLSSVLAGLVDFTIAFGVLLLMMLGYGITPSWAVLTLPLFVLLAICASLAVGLWLSALNAIYRDFKYVIPFLLQLGMFVSPVVYASAKIEGKLPGWALAVYGLNPMAGVIEGFRWALLGAGSPNGAMLAVSTVMTLALLVGGAYYFRRMERVFADLV
ncbi:MAG TPA: ABC transporter permease [Phycisphaerae bacterium]|nr:ABC transporter permease [Phycisphaerae bacterium]